MDEFWKNAEVNIGKKLLQDDGIKKIVECIRNASTNEIAEHILAKSVASFYTQAIKITTEKSFDEIDNCK